MKKPKKNASQPPVQADLAGELPAFDLFSDETMFGHPYEWQSWGLVIRHLRDYAEMDQTVFGRLLQGYTRAQISRYEQEASEPPVDFWVKLAKTFGLNITWAMTGKGLPYSREFCGCEQMERFYKWIRLIADKAGFLEGLRGDDTKK